MKSIRCAVLLCGVLTLLVAKDVSATLVTLTPTQDAFVFSGATGSNFDNDVEGLVMTDGVRAVWIQWDLSAIPNGATINSAHIKLHLYDRSDSNSTNMTYQGISSSNPAGTITFDETTITWATVPADGPNINLGTFTGVIAGNAPSVGEYLSLDADTDEIEHLQSIADNNGSFVYQLWGSGVSGTHHRYFVDREGNHNGVLGAELLPDLGPRLVIDYAAAIPEPSAFFFGLVVCCSIGGYAIARKRQSTLLAK